MATLSWTFDEITRWLLSLGLSEYVSNFKSHEITSGEVLLELQEEHLKELGIWKVGHRVLLCKKIQELKGSTNSHDLITLNSAVDIAKLFDKIVEEKWRRNSEFYPKKIFILRHGESEGNTDKRLYATVPDNKLSLTDRGIQQSRDAGKRIREIIGNESITCYVSPFMRSKQTFEAAKGAFQPGQVTWTEEPRIREQEWGNYQDPSTMDTVIQQRRDIGSFYFRFPTGESGADVFDRVSSFLETLHRDMKKGHCKQNILLVSHGLTCRLFLMRYYHWEVETFHKLWNFENGEFVMMVLQPEGGYRLETKLRQEP